MAAAAVSICRSQRKPNPTGRVDPRTNRIVGIDLFGNHADITDGFRKLCPVKCNIYDYGRWLFNDLAVGRTHRQSKPICHFPACNPDLFRFPRGKPAKQWIQRKYYRNILFGRSFDPWNYINIHYCSTHLTEALQYISIRYMYRSCPVYHFTDHLFGNHIHILSIWEYVG